MTDESIAALRPENVTDYPRPPRLEPVSLELRVEWNGILVARTTDGLRALVAHHAPTYYFPRADVLVDLVPTTGRRFCEWKGVAGYFNVELGDTCVEKAAWTYDTPTPTFLPLKGYLAFCAGLMTACYVGGVRALPQPSESFGGWVTPNLSGVIHGASGSLDT